MMLVALRNTGPHLTQMPARIKGIAVWGRCSVGSVAMKSQVLLSCVLLGVAAAQSASPLDAAYGMVRSCGDQPVSACFKRSAIVLVDAALDAGDTPLFTGLTLVKASPLPSERALNFETRSNASNDLDGQLVNKVAQFFSTRSLQLKIPQNTISDLKRSIEEGRKDKKKDYLLPFILALKLKAVALVPLVLGAIAMLALKALVVGKIALVLSGLIGLQKFLSGQQSTKTVEVVAHPTYSHESHHYRKRALDLPYAAHHP